MLRQIFAAYRGSRLWAGLERKYKVDRGVYVLVMPEDDAELNAAALGASRPGTTSCASKVQRKNLLGQSRTVL